MATIINSGYCANKTGFTGTGTKHCSVNIKDIRVIGLQKRGTDMGTATTPADMTLAYENQLQVEGKLFIFKNIYDLTDNTPEDSKDENPMTGVYTVSRKNPYDFTLRFDNDLAWNKAANQFNSFDQWDLVMWDGQGNKYFTQSVAGTLKGFTVGSFNTNPYKTGNGTESAKNSIMFQLKYRAEFDDRITWVVSNELDYFAEEDLDGVNQMLVDVTVPNVGDTALLFSISDLTKGIPNLEFSTADIVVKVNGVVEAGAVTYLGDGNYSKVIAASVLADTVTVQIEPVLISPCVYQSALETVVTI